MGKYIGRVVEIIYVDRFGRLSQRKVQVRDVRNGIVKAYCFESMAPRTFRSENILAVQLVRAVGRESVQRRINSGRAGLAQFDRVC